MFELLCKGRSFPISGKDLAKLDVFTRNPSLLEAGSYFVQSSVTPSDLERFTSAVAGARVNFQPDDRPGFNILCDEFGFHEDNLEPISTVVDLGDLFSFVAESRACLVPCGMATNVEKSISCDELEQIMYGGVHSRVCNTVPKNRNWELVIAQAAGICRNANVGLSRRNLSNVRVPFDVERIGDGEFRGRSRLETVDFESGSRLLAIGREAFANSGIMCLMLPVGLREIGDGAFGGCDRLARLDFGGCSGLELIGKGAFEKSGIMSVRFPASLQVISDEAFRGCCKLETVRFEENGQLVSIGGKAFAGTGVKDVVIPRSVEEIGECAFSECHILERVVFGDGSRLRVVGRKVFNGTAVRILAIPEHTDVDLGWFVENGITVCPTTK